MTFNLVHRSQRDPLAADETAPQRVLVPVSANVPQKKEKDPVSMRQVLIGTVLIQYHVYVICVVISAALLIKAVKKHYVKLLSNSQTLA